MKKSMLMVAFATAGLLLQWGIPAQAATPASATATGGSVFETMNASIIPESNIIWKLSGNLYNDKGNLDAKQLSAAQWTQVKNAAVAISSSAKTLVSATAIKSAPAGVKIQSEGTSGAFGAAEVQAAINKDLKGFHEHATKLVAVADEIAKAAGAHDAKKTDDAQSRMTDVCGACHQKFWYPNQPAK